MFQNYIYWFIRSGKITSVFGQKLFVVTKKQEVEFDKIREQWEKFSSQELKQAKGAC